MVELGVFGSLTVKMLGREDLLLMKMAALRPRDISDIRAMNPTTAELAFIEEQLERINAFDSKAALRIKLFLEAS